jgi:hypothetical protein
MQIHIMSQNKEIMAPVASKCINDWNQRSSSDRKVGLIAVAFDGRNHGGREVNSLANEAWRGGNVTHAQDMFRSSPPTTCARINTDILQYFSWYCSRY